MFARRPNVNAKPSEEMGMTADVPTQIPVIKQVAREAVAKYASLKIASSGSISNSPKQAAVIPKVATIGQDCSDSPFNAMIDVRTVTTVEISSPKRMRGRR